MNDFKKYKLLSKSIYKLKIFIKKIIWNILILTQPIKSNKIVVCNFYGKGYGCNPKYIIEEIINQNLKYDIVWLLSNIENNNEIPSEIRVVRYGSIKAMYELVTAKIWIDNCRKSFYPPKKRKSQYYIQTWHGGIGIKAVEKDVEKNLSSSYVNNAKNDSKMIDLLISNSKWCTELYERAFWYDGEILECGSPRVDILFNNNKYLKEKICKHYNINKEMKIVLYAPTFRNSGDLSIYNLNYKLCMKALEDKFGGEWTTFVRLHPNISNLSKGIKSSSSIINVTDYNDMQELLAISDILITDFSNSIFEFSYVKKPVFIYASDYEQYINERGFTVNLDKLPFNINKSNDELINDIFKFNKKDYIIKIEKMLKEFGTNENGNAAKEIVKKILEIK